EHGRFKWFTQTLWRPILKLTLYQSLILMGLGGKGRDHKNACVQRIRARVRSIGLFALMRGRRTSNARVTRRYMWHRWSDGKKRRSRARRLKQARAVVRRGGYLDRDSYVLHGHLR